MSVRPLPATCATTEGRSRTFSKASRWSRPPVALFLLISSVISASAQPACESLTKLVIPEVTISQAAVVPAGEFFQPSAGAGVKDLPAYCRVQAVIRPEIHFELWLPANWNRKFLMVGNGGLAGTISYSAMVAPLARGYATASTDTGHTADNDGHWMQGHMDRVIDYAHLGVHVTTEASKGIIRAFYGAPAQHSYFNGCSNGGEEALAEAQRYPGDYDGIIAGDPANYWTHLMMGAHLWITQALEATPESYIPASKTQMIGDAVYSACDALDGIKDGILNDPRKCHFDPATLLCKNGDAPTCLTAAQVETVKKIYQGGRTSDGQQIFPGILPGGEGPGGWPTWITGAAPGRGSHTSLGMPVFNYLVFNDPKWDFRSFRWDRTGDIDSDVELVDAALGPILNNINPDLAAFRSGGGKLIQYHGYSDPDISPLNSINYYQSVEQFVDRGTGRGLSETRNFYRLFMAPGMNHCGGGAGPDTFNMLAALDQWVEHGNAPEQVIAAHGIKGVVDMTRPLCAYPERAVYNGSGSTNEAANFSCKAP
jgi:feruloyl esterase